jgi:hypothetical protein
MEETDKTSGNRILPDDDKVIYVPMDEIRSIEKVIEKLEMTRNALQQVSEGMKPVE